jgi:hypothetical protein
MAQKVTLLFKEENVDFAKREAKRRGTSMSKMLDEHLDLLKRIHKKMLHAKTDPFIEKFGGMLKSDKNEDAKSR